MSARASAIPPGFICGALLLAACVKIPTGSDEVLSIEFAPLPSPSVVVGDTLRDSSGMVSPVRVAAFNYSGDVVQSPTIRYSAIDRGIRVDSLTGIVVGDSVRPTARILARVNGVNGTAALAVTYRPDTVLISSGRDSLLYSLTDTASNVSRGLGIRLLHGAAAGDTSVASYRVGFRILSPAGPPLARLVDDNGKDASADTTDAGGIATRRIKLDVTRLTSASDSIVVQANVRYRGISVKGSPARLVLKVKPR